MVAAAAKNRAAAATCGHGHCELPVILREAQKSLAASVFFCGRRSENLAISAAEWLRARLRPPWSLRFCDAIFVPRSGTAMFSSDGTLTKRLKTFWSPGCITRLAKTGLKVLSLEPRMFNGDFGQNFASESTCFLSALQNV